MPRKIMSFIFRNFLNFLYETFARKGDQHLVIWSPNDQNDFFFQETLCKTSNFIDLDSQF